MNSSNQNNKDEQLPRTVDKTYIEGAEGQETYKAPDSGKRNDASAGRSLWPGTDDVRLTQSFRTLAEGVRLGSGTIAGVLGAGGMAKIYKIWNEKLEIFRAIKILLPSHGPDLMQRFETEAKITAKLHHPNIVEIYTVGDYNGLPYLEMEYIEGEALDSIINRCRALPPLVCTAIGIFIARALVYAHNQDFLLYGNTYRGVIHRDLKPANIMISRKGDVRLMDFGIARPTETSLHTVDGNIVGTMQYLSPEQLDTSDIDRRTDIYSFGAILYEMLSGAKTFPQNTITNLLKMKSINQYRRLSEFPFPVSPPLARITHKCLELKKEDRYENAEELLHALEKAHELFTRDPPETVMRQFMTSPEQFAVIRHPGLKKLLLPALIGVGALAAVVLTITIVVVTRPLAPSPEVEEPKSRTLDRQTPAVRQQDTISPPRQEPVIDRHSETEYKPVGQPAYTKTVSSVRHSQQMAKAAETKRATAGSKMPAPSRLQQLKSDYSTNDLFVISRRSLDSDKPADALLALQALPSDVPNREKKNLYLLEAYIQEGRLGEARELAATITSGDAQFDFLRGVLEEKSSNENKALLYFQTALTKPSTTRDIQSVRKDALFFSAVIYDNRYRRSPTSETRLQMLNAWNVVKRSYAGNPEHSRFKTANTKLASIQ